MLTMPKSVNIRFYKDLEKREGIKDSKNPPNVFMDINLGEDIMLLKAKEDSLGLDSVSRLIQMIEKATERKPKEKSISKYYRCGKDSWHTEVLYEGK